MTAPQQIIIVIRWKLFKLLSRLGWWVCPEPFRTDLHIRMKLGGSPEFEDME